jgi:hypothetical protein
VENGDFRELKRTERGETAESFFGEDAMAFLPRADLDLSDSKYLNLLIHALSRIPSGTPPIHSLTKISLRKRGSLEGLVGLTRLIMTDHGLTRGPRKHTVTFYTELLRHLSDPSVIAIMVHELAHAWLNEHVRPEESRRREREADTLAREWGFEEELEALARETDPVTA